MSVEKTSSVEKNGAPEKQDAEKHGHDLVPGPHRQFEVLEEQAVAFDQYAHTSIPREHVSFEERIWYANAQRRSYGMHATGDHSFTNRWIHFFDNPVGPETADNPLIAYDEPLEKFDHMTAVRADRWSTIEADAARAKQFLRVAGWVSAFYLMTTDALGPFNAPFAISQLGWVPGLLSYFVMGLATFYSSWMLTNQYLRFDSDRHPVRTFADLMYVHFGWVGFWITVFCQVMLLYISGASNVLGAAQSVFQLDSGDFCFVVTVLLMAIAAYVISVPVRTIGWLSWLCSANVYLNLIVLFTSMGFLAHSDPDYTAAVAAYGSAIIPGPPYLPVQTEVIVEGLILSSRVNGVSNAIYAWGALQLFVEFLAEMRRPQHFWKSFTGGESLCLTVYLVYGSYVYYYQGQYTEGLSYQGIGNHQWQDVGNGISVFTQVTGCVLYTHIALKVIWQTIAEDVFGWPSVQVGPKGWILWFALNTVAYPIVFVVAAAIPQIFTISALFAALFGVQFSFVFPPLMQFAYDVRASATRLDSVYVPGEPVQYYDSWFNGYGIGWARWSRGLFGGSLKVKALKLINFLYILASLGMSGLTTWGSIEAIITTFANGAGSTFSCSANI